MAAARVEPADALMIYDDLMYKNIFRIFLPSLPFVKWLKDELKQ